jgi:RNA polymerase sigma-70 factor (ECF subfamily)
VAAARGLHDETELRTDELLAAAATADPHLFAELYRRHVAAVYRFCRHRTATREAAEDATSVVFLRALAGIATYQPGLGSFRAWLFGIAYRTVVDGYRRERPTAPIEAASEIPDERWQRSPELVAERAAAADGVDRLLAMLSDQQRAVVELRLAGLTGPEIATALGKSLASVKLAQFRAYGRLRTLLAPANQEVLRDDG